MLAFERLKNKETAIAVIGLGYVGLPIALEFARFFKVIGFDINEERIDLMKQGIDPSEELEKEAFENKDIEFSADAEVLKKASFYVVAVPTPVDNHKVPNLRPVLSASETIGKQLKKGDYVVFESTVYPGCTEEDCLPILEEQSGLKLGEDFKIGYSPERINPGDKTNTIEKIIKVVSGSDDIALKEISKVYQTIITAGVYEAPSIKVAEAAKVIENTQRDLNISFMNELSIIFDKMGINTIDVINAAATKWNFLRFYPGLVGGHCIGVDPYYLTYKSKKLGYDPQVILSGRRINDGMPAWVAKKTVQLMIKAGNDPKKAKVLVMGFTFKENVSDIRNSKVAVLVNELKDYSISVEVSDPHASPKEVEESHGIKLVDINHLDSTYDAVIVAVSHKDYRVLDMDYFKSILHKNGTLVDLRGLYNSKEADHIQYWSL